jgi:hypothetical protein
MSGWEIRRDFGILRQGPLDCALPYPPFRPEPTGHPLCLPPGRIYRGVVLAFWWKSTSALRRSSPSCLGRSSSVALLPVPNYRPHTGNNKDQSASPDNPSFLGEPLFQGSAIEGAPTVHAIW